METASLEFSLLVFVASVIKCREIGWMDYVAGMEEKSKAYSDVAGIRSKAEGI